MSLLIDGYNLIHAAGILPRGVGPGTLERSRLALLNVLAQSLSEAECSTTTVVFDAAQAPPGLPERLTHRGLTVWFSKHYDDADDLIEELIRRDHAPRKLVVVSSDHRLQRAAQRRKALFYDSDVWFAELIRQRQQQPPEEKPTTAKPSGPLSESEVEYWLGKFGESEDTRSKHVDADTIFPPGYAEDTWEE